ALVGAWAVGASLDGQARRDVEGALLLAVLLNAAVGLAETVADLGSLHLGRVEERAVGLLGNPVHLGAIAAGGLALVAVRSARRPLPWLPAAVLVGAALQASGSRAALVAAIGVVVWSVVTHGRRAGALLAVAAVVGLVVGGALVHVGGGVSVTQRAVQPALGGGLSARAATWWSARHAVVHRPLLGAGPGR